MSTLTMARTHGQRNERSFLSITLGGAISATVSAGPGALS